MSIRTKLTITISSLVFAILTLNVTFSHINALSIQRASMEKKIETIANQLAISLSLINDTNDGMENEIANSLRSAAIAAEQLLDPDFNNITNEQLVELSSKLNIKDITLWVYDNERELVSVRSSNPEEINLRSKTWDYWDVAMKQVMNLESITLEQGQALEHFYSGPINFAVSDPSKINKWGYYYSGNTNYMINTMINADESFENGYLEGKEQIINKLLAEHDELLEITAFNPDFFGKEKIIKLKNGIPVHNLDVRDIEFGTYEYKNIEQDLLAIKKTLDEQTITSTSLEVGNLSLTRTFIPISDEANPYIVSAVFDENKLFADVYTNFSDHILISIAIFIITLFFNFFLSKQIVLPLLKVIEKVNHISNNNFHYPLDDNRKDELGLLSKQINYMGNNLYNYTQELKKTANELRHTQQYLESFITGTTDGIFIIKLDYDFVSTNNAFNQLFGYDNSELIGRSLHKLTINNVEAFIEQLEIVKNGGSVTGYETIIYTKDNKPVHVSFSLSAIHNTNNEIVALAAIARDMTSYHENEQLIRQNEKLSAISQLSASIAHEFKNPLTTVLGFIKLNYSKGSMSKQHMEILLHEIEHMDLIVGQFLTMAKPQLQMAEIVDIKHMIDNIIILLESAGKFEQIKVSQTVNTSKPLVLGDKLHLKQAFVNLIKNSIEAMPDGGELNITLSEHNQQLHINISDSGVGMSKEDLEQLFKPFFSKKAYGTGLGLLVTQQVIVSHHGALNFVSKLGSGTTVQIILPLHHNL